MTLPLHLEPDSPSNRPWWVKVPRAMLRDPSISVAAKVLAILLLDYGWAQGYTYLGDNRIKAELRLSDRDLEAAAEELQARYGVRRVLRQDFSLPSGANPVPIFVRLVWDLGPLLQLLGQPSELGIPLNNNLGEEENHREKNKANAFIPNLGLSTTVGNESVRSSPPNGSSPNKE